MSTKQQTIFLRSNNSSYHTADYTFLSSIHGLIRNGAYDSVGNQMHAIVERERIRIPMRDYGPRMMTVTESAFRVQLASSLQRSNTRHKYTMLISVNLHINLKAVTQWNACCKRLTSAHNTMKSLHYIVCFTYMCVSFTPSAIQILK